MQEKNNFIEFSMLKFTDQMPITMPYIYTREKKKRTNAQKSNSICMQVVYAMRTVASK